MNKIFYYFFEFHYNFLLVASLDEGYWWIEVAY